jgi:hypothetical protein
MAVGVFRCALLSVGIGLLASDARADAVISPPKNCPPGAIGDTSHNGPWCRPTSCVDDDDCKKELRWNDKRPRVCVDQALCVEQRSEKSRSGWSHGTPFRRAIAHGECAADASCKIGTCERAKRCVVRVNTEAQGNANANQPSGDTRPPTDDGATPGGKRGCGGCVVTGGGSAPVIVMALMIIGALRLSRLGRRGTPRWAGRRSAAR